MTPMLMPFGKHKGKPVEDLPTEEWCLGNLERIAPSLQKEMENQLAARQGAGIVRTQGR